MVKFEINKLYTKIYFLIRCSFMLLSVKNGKEVYFINVLKIYKQKSVSSCFTRNEGKYFLYAACRCIDDRSCIECVCGDGQYISSIYQLVEKTRLEEIFENVPYLQQHWRGMMECLERCLTSTESPSFWLPLRWAISITACLLYTSDAADE